MAKMKTAPAPAGEQVRIRMYRIGFGDCFLVSLPAHGGPPQHVLVDCGVHGSGSARNSQEIVDNIKAETGGKLALVIATHAHQDHISGFSTCAATFREFEVGEVWLPWTEDPLDAQAMGYKRHQLALLHNLQMHFAAAGDAPTPRRAAALEVLQNLAGNASALQLLKAGISGGRVRYMESGATITDAASIKGLQARILGPPRDEKFLGQMEPKGHAKWFRAAGDGASATGAVSPFEGRTVSHDGSRKLLTRGQYRTSRELLGDVVGKIRDLANDPEGLAFALDSAINNTSVVALLSYGGKHLLFPGDAQYGNWAAWMDTPDGKEILGSVTFLKVGHHGSHNATPRSVVEAMPSKGFTAMVSTQSVPWDSIPLDDLMGALEARASAVVRSDSIHVDAPRAPDGPDIDKPLPDGFAPGSFWIDHAIQL